MRHRPRRRRKRPLAFPRCSPFRSRRRPQCGFAGPFAVSCGEKNIERRGFPSQAEFRILQQIRKGFHNIKYQHSPIRNRVRSAGRFPRVRAGNASGRGRSRTMRGSFPAAYAAAKIPRLRARNSYKVEQRSILIPHTTVDPRRPGISVTIAVFGANSRFLLMCGRAAIETCASRIYSTGS